MNAKRFKVIFSKRRNALMVVGENASSVTKAQGTSDATAAHPKIALQSFVGALSCIFLAVNCAYAEPTGGEFAAGAGAIATAGALTTIQQTTQQAIVNWQSFSSASHETIQFVQPNANAAILNRVVGSLPSQLNGTLIGNGHVYLINQNGIVLGANGTINVHGNFVGSTRDVSNDAFMAGGALVFKGESIGNIQILGKVKAEQGDIVLIAQKTNISQGAELVAGEKIQLVAANEVQLTNGKITIKPSSSDAGQITVEGALKAAQVQLAANNNNLGALAINTTGTIRATGTQTNPDGSVDIMAYGDGSNIKVAGTVEATDDNGAKGGRIIIGRNEETGALSKSTDVSGATLITNKGFVETSGHQLTVDGAQVSAKDWLLDPDNIEITDAATWTAGYSKISASTISTALNTTNVVIQTTGNETGVLNNSVASGDGNILVSAAITKTGTGLSTLTLTADNGITVNQKISSTGGALGVEMTANGGATNTANSKGITLNAVIDANGGVVTLTGTNRNAVGGNANSGVVFNAGSGLAAGNFVVKGYQLGAALASNTDKNGIYFNGASTLKSTGASSLEGTSNSKGNLGAGIYAETGANLTLDSGTTGTMLFVGGNSNAGYRSVRLGGLGNATIGVTGNVTFEGKAAPGMPGDAVFLRANVTQNSNSTLTLKGGSVEVYAGTILDKVTNATNTTLNLGDTTPAYANGVVNVGSGGGLASLAADKINVVGSTLASGQQGVLIQAGSRLTANTIYVKGSALGDAGINATAKGIHLSNGILNATNNITLDGTSTNVTGVALETGSVTSSGGAVVIKATTTAGQYQGANIVVAVSGKSVEITGNSTNHRGVNIGAAVTSTGGGVTIEGTSINSTGVYVNNSVTSTAGDIKITGISNKADGVYVGNSPPLSKITANDGAINISGTSDQQRGVWLDGNAVVQSIKSLSTPLTSVGVTIKGKSTGGAGTNQVGAQIQGVVSAAGKLTIAGDSLGIGTYQGVNIAKAVSGDTVEITGSSAKHYGVGITGSVTSTSASPGTVIGTSPNAFTSGDIKIDGTSAGSIGVYLSSNSSTAAINAKNDLNIKGTSTAAANSQHGVFMYGTATVQGKNVTVTGESINGNAVQAYSTLAATGGDVNITGTSSTASALSLQGAITADQNVVIKGENTQTTNGAAVAYINKAVTATNGKIDITTTTVGTTSNALQLVSGANLTGKTAVNITTDTLSIASGAAVNATTGTVTVKTDSAAAKIDVGAGDAGSATPSSRTLGLSTTELGLITASNTIIGDTSNTGGITVSATTTTNATTGNVTLVTGGNIAVNAALTVGDTAATRKNLTLNGAATGPNTSTIWQNSSGIIKAAGLELLGANATHTLTNTGNAVGTLAADTNKVDFTNGSALIVGIVNGTTGIKTQTGASITTQTGDLNLNESIKNQASGNVVVGAAISKGAGDGTGGDVKTASGKGVTHTGGNLYVYSGSAANTGALSNLDSTNFSTLKVDGTSSQNADTNVAYNALSLGIAGSTAPAQVMFREALAVDSTVLAATTLVKTYGDSTTATSAAEALLAEAKGALKNNAANSGTNSTFTTGAENSNNRIVVSKAVVVESLNNPPALTAAEFSSAGFLKAKDNTYKFAGLTSSKYVVTGVDVGVDVAQRNAEISATGNTVVFNSAQQTDGVTKRGFIDGDKIDISGMGTGVQAGSYASNLRVSGDDSSNYNVTYKNAALTINAQTYVRPPNEVTTLTPVSFGLAYAGGATAAGGDGVDISSACDAWSQRAGAGFISVMTLLKPNIMGLRTAKTDNMDAMTGGTAASLAGDVGDSPCGSAGLANKQAGL